MGFIFVRCRLSTVLTSVCESIIKFTHKNFHTQCRVVKITVLGKEGVPVQVDGEAWVQPPGVVKIVHKNRAQMLVRDKVSLIH